MRLALGLSTLLAAASLAGCAADATTGGAAVEAAADATAPREERASGFFTWTALLATCGLPACATVGVGGDGGSPLDVPANATNLTVRFEWTPTTPAAESLAVSAWRGSSKVAAGEGPSPLELRVIDAGDRDASHTFRVGPAGGTGALVEQRVDWAAAWRVAAEGSA